MEQRLEAYSQAQKQDPVCFQVREFCKTGWPRKQHVWQELALYWKAKDRLTICDNLLLYNSRSYRKTLYRGYTQVILGLKSARIILCLVAWRNAADCPVGSKLPKMCKREQAWKRTIDQHTLTQVSMANGPLRGGQEQLSSAFHAIRQVPMDFSSSSE